MITEVPHLSAVRSELIASGLTTNLDPPPFSGNQPAAGLPARFMKTA
jgi:hypothetical protein